ncbi:MULTISPECIES: group 1 truncated hemoglobin [unclassified Streptomyces]|uniref:group I truncated hemoglobin n=1 Tax=unclassified Streptomyces TaxID=2593676 RepID=UPI00278BD066|nr:MULTISPECIES: group 1 truncated hemoglobin [unclassified Streptomyces]
MTHIAPNSPTNSDSSTIFEKIGGADAVGTVVDILYDRILADEELAPYFMDVDLDRLKEHQRLFVGQALGSTEIYPGRVMAHAHAPLAITDTAFDRVVDHLGAALAEAGVDEATIGTIAGTLSPLRKDIVTA